MATVTADFGYSKLNKRLDKERVIRLHTIYIKIHKRNPTTNVNCIVTTYDKMLNKSIKSSMTN